MTSVVIPAHNEEYVIDRCLRGVLESRGEEPEIVVVCNGCSDRTADVARGFGAAVRVIEIEQASKTRALNVGDCQVRSFPRFYLDADVVLSPNALGEVAAVLETEEPRIAAPRMRVVFDSHPWSVRAFYAIWTRLPYLRSGAVGSGVYAVSQPGRERFKVFPDIIADDEYARAHFTPNETRIVESCRFEIYPPRSLGSVIRVNTRFSKGNLELRRRFPSLSANLRKEYRSALREFLKSPGLWPALGVYLFVYAMSRSVARWKTQTGQLGWERDEGSRASVPITPRGERAGL
jgi:glycosyltransferase involved in cell wall biosynthesis